MMKESQKSALLQYFPSLAALPEDLSRDILDRAQVLEAPAGAVLFERSGPCQAFPMVIQGAVRVVKQAENGREIELYRVGPGESCILTSSCLLGNARYPARGVAEGALTAVVLSRDAFNRLLERHGPFRQYIFGLFADRLADLMELVEEVAFRRLDQRLARHLLARGEDIRTTHQALADELGSVREIVSRLLKSFEDQGLVALAREHIRVLDPEGLKAMVSGRD